MKKIKYDYNIYYTKREKLNLMKILFIRHGQTQYNAELRWLGSTDNPLCEAGKKELLEKKTYNKKI